MRIPILHEGRNAALPDDDRNYTTDDDAERISFW
jgi:hypothetical protein